jgi:estrogen-related receptor beta like 1
MRPLNRHYFVLQTNPGEQFFLFTSLAAWLIRKTGKRFDPPQEFDDPNSTISNILEQVRKLGVTIDFPPSKLKQGYGEHAIFVLDRLSDEALRHTHFAWSNPVPPVEEGHEEEDIDEDMEVGLSYIHHMMKIMMIMI